MRLPQGLAAFQHRNYRLFWFGQLISVTGTWMQSLAQAWLVLTLTDSAFKLGLVSVFQFAPMLVFGLLAGMLADRLPKRKLLVVTQSLSGVLAGVLALLVFTDRVQLWHVYALALGLGVVNAFDMTTRQAFVVDMVGKEHLMNAIALNSSLFNAARIIGPAIAGLLLAVFGPGICFLINALSYIAVVAGLLAMRLEHRPARMTSRGLQQIREGLTYVRATPAVLLPMALVGFVATFGINFNVWIPLLAKQNLHAGASGFGLLMAASGVGSLIGALALAFFMQGPKRLWMLGMAALLGVLELGLALAGAIPLALPIAMLLLAGIGFASSSTMATANTTVQTNSPDELRGRVMSVYMTINTGTAPFGGLIAGGMASRYGTPASLALGGLVTLLAAGAALGGGRALAISRHVPSLPWRSAKV
jgi:MFS family permease